MSTVFALTGRLLYAAVFLASLVVNIVWILLRAVIRKVKGTFGVTRAARTGDVLGPESTRAACAKEVQATHPATLPEARCAERLAPSDEGGESEPEAGVLYMPTDAADSPQPDGSSAQPRRSALERLGKNDRPPRARVTQRRVQHEKRWVGTLAEHGLGQFSDRKTGREYASYYVRIDSDGGSIVTKRGVELEQAIAYAGVKPGDRVELLFLGREAVSVDDNGQAARKFRNRWRINPID